MGDVPLTPLLLILLFAALALAEVWRPARAAQRRRWPINLTFGLANAGLVRLLSAAAPVTAALWAQGNGVGLFNAVVMPLWVEVMLVIVAMDFAIYWQHRALHVLPWGWALHRLHHADTDFDVTTGVRFHPGEALLSMLYKAALIILLGASPVAALAFEAYLAIGSMIEHANIRLPTRVDAALRRIWVTPDVHRIHHSAHGEDHNHNYGFAIGLWDRWFGTYRVAPSGPKIGLPQAAGAD